LPIPDKPGLGIELDDEAMADKIGAIFRPQSPLHPDDGTVVDW
jgi:galactonate dehydratase